MFIGQEITCEHCGARLSWDEIDHVRRCMNCLTAISPKVGTVYRTIAGHIEIRGGPVSRMVIKSMIEASGIHWYRADTTDVYGYDGEPPRMTEKEAAAEFKRRVGGCVDSDNLPEV